MNRIPCQGKHSATGGCRSCGGYGYVLEQAECAGCHGKYWDRERQGTTVFDGKELTAFDGTELVYRNDKGFLCSKCAGGASHE